MNDPNLTRPMEGRPAKEQGPVALFLPSMEGGGAERAFGKIANALARRSIPVDLLLRRKKGAFLGSLDPAVRVVDLRAPVGFLGLADHLRRNRPRVLMCGLVGPNLVAGTLKRLGVLDVPLVLNVRNMDDEVISHYGPLKKIFCRFLYPRALRAADRLVAVSQGVKEGYLREKVHVPGDRITVLYNPVIDPEFQARRDGPILEKWFQEGLGPYILAVGRLEPQKDYPTLLRAFAKLRGTKPLKLLILGEGRERKKLEALAGEWGLADQLVMPGFIPNPLPFMKRAELFVLSSRYEGFGNVLVEAMGCGVPVVSTDCPSGPSEVLGNGKWGRLVPPGDWEALAQAMGEALEDPVRPDFSGWLGEFAMEPIVRKYMDLLGIPQERPH